MKVKYVNYNHLKKFIHDRVEYLDISSNMAIESQRSNESSEPDFSRFLNKNSGYIFPDIDKTLPIIFYDFPVWTKFKSLPNNILGRLDTSYKPHKECIYIREKTLTNKNDFYNELNKDSENFIDIDTAANITILHELGHAVHHQTEKLNGRYLHEGTEEAKFINEFMSFEELVVSQHEMSGKIVETEMIARQATREGYADLYCCILLDKLYGKEKAFSIINALYDFRVKSDSVNAERYYSYGSIDEYRKNMDRLELKNFDEIHRYISGVVIKTTINHINSTARGFYSHSNFLGALNSVFSINEPDVKVAVQKIEDRFPFLCIYHDKLTPWRFEQGTKDGKTWLDNRNLNALQRNIRTVKLAIENKVKYIMNNPYRKRP
ncbi:hypothetical protein AAHK15_000722 [Salmonella enterica]